MRRDDWRLIPARYRDKCSRCGKRIKKQDVVEWSAIRHKVRCATGTGCNR